MAGYDWMQGKSNNAVAAEMNGMVPKSKITRELLELHGIELSVKDVKALIAMGEFRSSEWHHTSSRFNRTEFYDLTDLAERLEDEAEAEEIQEGLKKHYNLAQKAKEEAKEDIHYGVVKITSFEKVRGRWFPVFEEFPAKVEGYYSKTLVAITRVDGMTFRKKYDNIEMTSVVTEKEFRALVKKEHKERLEEKKKLFLEQNQEDLHAVSEELLLKYKRTRSDSGAEKIERKIREKLEAFRKEREIVEKEREIVEKQEEKDTFERLINTHIDDISRWVRLSGVMRHPAPQHIYQIKMSSGMSWAMFEERMKIIVNQIHHDKG